MTLPLASLWLTAQTGAASPWLPQQPPSDIPGTAPEVAPTRSIFLNGLDVSSARSQELKGVDVTINENGDVFITAPHYQVNEEDTYVPLSKYVQGAGSPEHKALPKLNTAHGNDNGEAANAKPAAPAEASAAGALAPKAGTPASTDAAAKAATTDELPEQPASETMPADGDAAAAPQAKAGTKTGTP